LVSLVDRHRQWFKSRVGLAATETPREVAFCAHTILTPDTPFVVGDALADDRFATNPLVAGEPHVRFYAGVPLVSSAGFAVGTVCVIDHVPRTLRPEQLAALLALARQVVTQLEMRTNLEELRQMRDAALVAAREKAQFCTNMSHEVRTPMNGIIGMADLLLAEELGPEQRDAVETIRSSAQAMFDLIESSLDLGAIEAGGISLDISPLVPSEVVRSVIAEFAHAAERRGLSLSHDLATAGPAVTGDSSRVRQIIRELVRNALKFTSRGAITVRTRYEAETERDVTLRVSVSDTGIGIAPSLQRRLFRPFAIGDGSLTRTHGGLGLGLGLAASLVELMGGEIGVDSVVEQGSTFWFTLPLAKAPT
jgi:signal transduction histidine kinase